MGSKVFQGGMDIMQTASLTLQASSLAAATSAAQASGAGAGAIIGAGSLAAAPGPIGLILTGVIFSAETGLDYRRYKKGEISKAEF